MTHSDSAPADVRRAGACRRPGSLHTQTVRGREGQAFADVPVPGVRDIHRHEFLQCRKRRKRGHAGIPAYQKTVRVVAHHQHLGELSARDERDPPLVDVDGERTSLATVARALGAIRGRELNWVTGAGASRLILAMVDDRPFSGSVRIRLQFAPSKDDAATGCASRLAARAAIPSSIQATDCSSRLGRRAVRRSASSSG